MLSEESKLRKAIEELAKLPQNLKNGAVDLAKGYIDKARNTFTRENLVNATVPKFLARGVNKAFDLIGSKSKSKVESKQTETISEKPDTEVSEEDEDDEMDVELLEELLNTMDEGFEETNKNLAMILMRLSGSKSLSGPQSTAPLLLGYSKQAEESTAEIIDVSHKELDVTEKNQETLVELLDINGIAVKTLKAIEKNTHVDELKRREEEFEANRQKTATLLAAIKENRTKEQNAAGNKSGKGSIAERLVDAALGYAGIKTATGKLGGKILGGAKGAAGSILGGIKGAAGSVLQGAKAAGVSVAGMASNAWKNAGGAKGIWGAIRGAVSKAPGPLKALGLIGAGTAATTAAVPALSSTLLPTTDVSPIAPNDTKISSTSTNIAKVAPATNVTPESTNITKVVGAIAPTATKGGLWQSVKGVGGKILGAPLTLGIGALDAYNVSKDESLTSEQKTTEYSKIGGRTTGALAGAEAGATIGLAGGPLGAAIGAAIGGIGGYFLGEKGGEIVGNIINAFSPSSEKNTTNAKTTKVDVTNVVKPDIGLVTPGQTRVNNLQALTHQIEQINAEKQDMKVSPTIVPVTINNQNNPTTGGTEGSQRQRNPVPIVRNQDGTIQRLLDLNYSPLLRN